MSVCVTLVALVLVVVPLALWVSLRPVGGEGALGDTVRSTTSEPASTSPVDPTAPPAESRTVVPTVEPDPATDELPREFGTEEPGGESWTVVEVVAVRDWNALPWSEFVRMRPELAQAELRLAREGDAVSVRPMDLLHVDAFRCGLRVDSRPLSGSVEFADGTRLPLQHDPEPEQEGTYYVDVSGLLAAERVPVEICACDSEGLQVPVGALVLHSATETFTLLSSDPSEPCANITLSEGEYTAYAGSGPLHTWSSIRVTADEPEIWLHFAPHHDVTVRLPEGHTWARVFALTQRGGRGAPQVALNQDDGGAWVGKLPDGDYCISGLGPALGEPPKRASRGNLVFLPLEVRGSAAWLEFGTGLPPSGSVLFRSTGSDCTVKIESVQPPMRVLEMPLPTSQDIDVSLPTGTYTMALTGPHCDSGTANGERQLIHVRAGATLSFER